MVKDSKLPNGNKKKENKGNGRRNRMNLWYGQVNVKRIQQTVDNYVDK